MVEFIGALAGGFAGALTAEFAISYWMNKKMLEAIDKMFISTSEVVYED